MEPVQVLAAVLIGVGATVVIDLWALFLRRAFQVRSLDYCLLGRWVLHMPGGMLVHASIAAASRKRHECAVGWTTHYLIGTGFAMLFVAVAPRDWLTRPTLLPALAFGAGTVLVPYFTMQPAFGLGIAAAKTAQPTRARLKSLMTHTLFGVGLYVSALLTRRVLFAT
jgi:hypothetical protein